MDYADKLDMMDDDCDIQGFPLESIAKAQTNYDRIKAMSVDEMAEFLEAETYDSCEHTASWYTEWLNSPAEGGADIIRTGSPGNFRTNSGRLWLNDWQAQD